MGRSKISRDVNLRVFVNYTLLFDFYPAPMGRSKISRDANLSIVLSNSFVRGIAPLFLCPSQFPFTPVPSALTPPLS